MSDHLTSPALCPLGHRIIPSTCAHWSMREVGPGLYEYVTGECAAVAAACSPAESVA